MDRLSVIDASFIYSEDGQSHNDVGMVLVFEGPHMSREELMQAIAERIALVPRFRQKVRHMPFNAGLPVWIDDVQFDMGRHVRYHPAPTHPDPIGAAVSRIMSTPMDLTIPLWQMHIVNGLADGRWLLIVRMHHAMVDGVSSTEIVRLMLSTQPDGDPPIIDTWRPRPEMSDDMLLARLATDAAKEMANVWVKVLTGRFEFPKPPQTFDPSPFMRPGTPLNPAAINGPVRTGRQYGMLEVPLEALERLRRDLSCTVNDLVLAACGYGYSSVIAEYLDEKVQDRTMRVMVPVSLRPPDPEGVDRGNEIGAMIVEVPLGAMPARDRLARIREQTEAFKEMKRHVPVASMIKGSSLASPMMLMMGSRMTSTAPALVNTTITNVPGPQNPLYLHGRRMHRLGACIALWTPLKIAIAVMSYNGMATFNAVTDEATFPTVQPLLDAIQAGVDDLIEAAEEA